MILLDDLATKHAGPGSSYATQFAHTMHLSADRFTSPSPAPLLALQLSDLAKLLEESVSRRYPGPVSVTRTAKCAIGGCRDDPHRAGSYRGSNCNNALAMMVYRRPCRRMRQANQSGGSNGKYTREWICRLCRQCIAWRVSRFWLHGVACFL
jgi:hypothetical protein